MDGVYSQEIRLKNRDVDMHRRLRTSRLFELLQEAAIAHTEALGMGREKTLDRGLLWVVTLQRAEIARMPEYDELIRVESWPGETMHVLFPRFYSLETFEGESLVKASALWTLVDSKTRKMVFPERNGIVIEEERTGYEIGLPSPPKAIGCPNNRNFTVPFSFVDLNGHMNNTGYFDLAEDMIGESAKGRQLKEISTEYSSEIKIGESMELKWGNEYDLYYLEGNTERRVFRMSLKY